MKLYNQNKKYSQSWSSPVSLNYKTTFGAILTVLSYVLPLLGVPIPPAIADAAMVIGTVIIGIFAKDSNVTGGTKPQTKEAEDRAAQQ